MPQDRTETDFQVWLKDQLERRNWSQLRLGKEIGVFRGTVGRWLNPTNEDTYRVPRIESFIRLGELFGADPLRLMDMAGIEANSTEAATQLQRDVIAVVLSLPDSILITVYPQLRALLDSAVQQGIAAGSKG